MKRSLRMSVSVLLVCSLALVFMHTALASGPTLVATTGVNMRREASTDAEIVTGVGPGTVVEVLSHDPAGWSRVKANDSEGFIRSDFLALPADAGNVAFKTTEGVNFRSGPSTDAERIRGIGTGNEVEMISHDPSPGGWSKVLFEGAEGYVSSEFLALQIRNTQQSSSANIQSSGANTQSSGANTQSSSQAPSFFRTTDGVNFRTGPSTDASIIRALSTGTRVVMLDHNPNGWSKVRVSEREGFIRSDFLAPDRNSVARLHMSEVRSVIKAGMTIHVLDVRTGTTYNIRAFSVGRHADVEPITQADTDAHSRTHNHVRSWAARPVWVTVNGRTFAAALHGMPHAGSTIRDNGMDGHLCLHFADTVANDQSYQADLRRAVEEAWAAAQR